MKKSEFLKKTASKRLLKRELRELLLNSSSFVCVEFIKVNALKFILADCDTRCSFVVLIDNHNIVDVGIFYDATLINLQHFKTYSSAYDFILSIDASYF